MKKCETFFFFYRFHRLFKHFSEYSFHSRKPRKVTNKNMQNFFEKKKCLQIGRCVTVQGLYLTESVMKYVTCDMK